eukprot:SAG31_NODE_12363_length_947_cov_1.373821_2_plen_79_part_00
MGHVHVTTGTVANVATHTCAAAESPIAIVATTVEVVLVETVSGMRAILALQAIPWSAVLPAVARRGVMPIGLAGIRLR